jgi:hypothetical protein
LALLLGGVFFGATQLINRTAASDQQGVAPTETAIAQAVATAAAAPTQTPAPRATTPPQATTPPRPTVAPTIAAAAAPQVAPTPVPTTAPATATSVSTAPEPTSAPTAEATPITLVASPVDPALAEEVRAAYLHYFDVRTQALYTNDPTGLDTVADGPPLAGLEQSIADHQAEGKALVTNVKHHYAIVHFEGDPNDVVAVADDYKDLSYWVDTTTHDPLPGQTIPSNPDEAPQVNVVYHLRNIDGVWKVIEGQTNVGPWDSP